MSSQAAGTQSLWAEHALTASGWARHVTVRITHDGRIATVEPDTEPHGQRAGVLLPAPSNLHSHAFQRAMAGMAERRGPDAGRRDSFWTWREVMYGFLRQLNPDDVQAISAFAYMQMLQVGFAAVGEFHYLHHQPNGKRYTELAELAHRIAAAASDTGIGLTLLPVLYQQSGCDGRPLSDAQARFGNDMTQFEELLGRAGNAVAQLGGDALTGVAAHSLRAVPANTMTTIADLMPTAPVHIHIAEQVAEVDEVVAATGQRPVQWLLDHCDVNERWVLIHATHMTPAETAAVAASNAVAGLCPITEANLGDGIFDGATYLQGGGRFGVGSDSNVRISLAGELCQLEYSQRLKLRERAVFARSDASAGRVLYESAARGGAQAIGRNAGQIATGRFADLLALDDQSTELSGLSGDDLLDSYLFAAGDNLVTDVWCAGRHMVQAGRHTHCDRITSNYRATINRLRAAL